ncbi:MAG: O-antigen ligase family protein [Minwuia sp.]|uniref:O-antigen ligase family protein n=1 Tax=Minwuia sp. TaxID=2493630 RepID=UPI003A867039
MRLAGWLWTASSVCLGAAAPLLSLGRITMLAVFAGGVLFGLAAIFLTCPGELASLARRNLTLIVPAGLFLVFGLISSLISVAPVESSLKVGDLAVQFLLLYAALAVVTLCPPEARARTVTVFLAAMGASVLYTLGDSSACVANGELTELYRWCSKRARHRGTAFSVLLPLAVGLWLAGGGPGARRRIGLKEAALVFLFAVAVFLSSSRTGTVVVFGGVAVLLVLALFQGRIRDVWLAAPAVLLALGFSVLVFSMYAPDFSAARLDTTHAQLGAFGGREAAWRAAVESWLIEPWLGIGVWNFREFHDHFSHPHNFALEILSETGILGAAAIGLLLLVTAWRLLRLLGQGFAVTGMLAGIAAFFAAALAATSIFYGWWLCILFSVLTVGTAAVVAQVRREVPDR